MNWFDIIVVATLGYCLWSGWRSGILVQLSGIIGIILGVWAAFRFSTLVGQWLGIVEDVPYWVLFAVVLVAVMVIVIVLSRLVTQLFRAGGLALPLRMLGALFAVAKGVLVLSLLLLVVRMMVETHGAGQAESQPGANNKSLLYDMEQAKSYDLLNNIGRYIFPYITPLSSAAGDVIRSIGIGEDYPTVDPAGISSVSADSVTSRPSGDSAIKIIP